jgi:FSR family fosmidomycin resistance protein-like MFS transporter
MMGRSIMTTANTTPDNQPAGTGFQTERVVTIATGHAVHDTFTAFLPPLLPRFVEKFALSNTAAGLLTVFLQIPSLLQAFIGHLARNRALRWLVVLGPGVTATAMSLLGWAPGYWGLAVLLLIAGVSVASFHATAPVAVGYLSGSRLGRGMGFFMVGGETGRTIGPLVVVSALAILSLRSLAFLALAGIATSIVLHFRLGDTVLHREEGAEPVPWRSAIRSMRGLMVLLAGMIVVRSLMMMSVTTFLPLYLTDTGRSHWLSGAALSIVEAAGIAGAMAGGWVSDHIGRRAVLIFGFSTAPVALLLFLAADGVTQLALLPVIGVTLLSVPPVLMALVQEQVPESRALANGVYLSLSFAIRSVAAIAFGAVGDAFGLSTAMTIGALAMFLGLPLIWLLFRHQRGAKTPPGISPVSL